MLKRISRTLLIAWASRRAHEFVRTLRRDAAAVGKRARVGSSGAHCRAVSRECRSTPIDTAEELERVALRMKQMWTSVVGV
jgi:hypothetical protein